MKHNTTKMNIKIKLFFIVLVFFQLSLIAQDETYTLTGTVTEASEKIPLPGVNILVKGTANGTSSDFDGNYAISVKQGDVLEFLYVGFKTQSVTITGQTTINIVLEEDAAELEQVVVVGYGSVKKKNLSSSISKVVNDQLDQIPTGRVDDALNGQLSGINIQSSDPSAGEAPRITIRGQGSVAQNSSPLVVIDGIAVGNDGDFLSSLDMNDVASVQVLKDASSAAIYGSRGANGIILIETKDGVEGKTKFTYNTFIGYKNVQSRNVLPDYEAWKAYTNQNLSAALERFDPDDDTGRQNFINTTNNRFAVIDRLVQAQGGLTDWEEEIFDGGFIKNHSFAVRGGTKGTRYSFSLGFLDDEGVLLTDNFKKINASLKLDTKVNDQIKFGIRINPSITNQTRFPIGIHDALRQSPWLQPRITEANLPFVNRFTRSGQFEDFQVGDYTFERTFDDFDLETNQPVSSGVDISNTSNINPIAKILERNNTRRDVKIVGSTYFQFQLGENLTFKQNIGGDYRTRTNNDFTGINATRNGATDSGVRERIFRQTHLVSESTLNFNLNSGGHNIDAIGGFAYEEWERDFSDINSRGFSNNDITTISFPFVIDAETNKAEEKLVSYFGRINYTYDDRYILSLSARTDGSSKFGNNNKFGFFPAGSVAWRIGNEAFLQDSDIISELKLRASYGITGNNDPIGEYDFLAQLITTSTSLGGSERAVEQINIENPDLKWERLIEFNPGIDFGLFNDRFNVSFDYYTRTTKDLLLPKPVPAVTGFEQKVVNQGEIKNEGFELEISTRNISTNNFKWNSTALFTRNENTLVDFAGANGLISIIDDKRPAEFIAVEGRPITSFYGYVKDPDREIPLRYIKDPFYPIGAQSQDVYVKDLNGDGKIDTDDRTFLGDPYPDLIWSVTNTFKIYDFDFSFMFQGSHGAQVRNIDSQYILNEFSSKQDFTSDFPDADLVRQRIFTDEDIQDAEYIALRNINLGYTFPSDFSNTIGISRLRVYIGGQNLVYIFGDNYEGYNPEGIKGGENNPLTFGYQRGAAPINRTYSFGVNLEF